MDQNRNSVNPRANGEVSYFRFLSILICKNMCPSTFLLKPHYKWVIADFLLKKTLWRTISLNYRRGNM
jgi:hypothetical protein